MPQPIGYEIQWDHSLTTYSATDIKIPVCTVVFASTSRKMEHMVKALIDHGINPQDIVIKPQFKSESKV